MLIIVAIAGPKTFSRRKNEYYRECNYRSMYQNLSHDVFLINRPRDSILWMLILQNKQFRRSLKHLHTQILAHNE